MARDTRLTDRVRGRSTPSRAPRTTADPAPILPRPSYVRMSEGLNDVVMDAAAGTDRDGELAPNGGSEFIGGAIARTNRPGLWREPARVRRGDQPDATTCLRDADGTHPGASPRCAAGAGARIRHQPPGAPRPDRRTRARRIV